MAALTLAVDDPDALRALIETDLSKRRAFVPGASGVEVRSACDLVIHHAGRTHTLAGEVVFVRDEDPGRGVGLALAPLDVDALSLLRAFAQESSEAGEGASEEAGAEGAAAGPSEVDRDAPPRLHERLLALSGIEQQRLAASGTLPERIALERMYGPNVWATLLENGRLTIPEVARIARKGTLPRPLVEAVAANATWLAAGEVQRALLSNPRASAAVVDKVLRALSRRDLQRVPVQTAYAMPVRLAAKRMLGD
ncbi:MAG: hypothetical protein ACREJ3_17485 [Polyangiaceae bacterium]